MKYYYEEHLKDYRQVKDAGMISRGELYGTPDFDDFSARPFLEAVLPTLQFSSDSPDAYEYGCGTGPGACFLAQRGFNVDASDLVPDAIDIAREQATLRNLNIRYEVLDIVELPHEGKQYDLIVDSYCLQGIVFEDDRQKVFSAVKSRLKPGGCYLVNSAFFDAPNFTDIRVRDEVTNIVYNRYQGNQLIDMSTYIVYRPFDADPAQYQDVMEINGNLYLPVRRHYPHEMLKKEIEDAGFKTIPFEFPEDGHLICVLP